MEKYEQLSVASYVATAIYLAFFHIPRTDERSYRVKSTTRVSIVERGTNGTLNGGRAPIQFPTFVFRTKIFPGGEAKRGNDSRGAKRRKKKKEEEKITRLTHKVRRKITAEKTDKVIIVITPIYLPRRAKLSAACNFLCRGAQSVLVTLGSDGR